MARTKNSVLANEENKIVGQHVYVALNHPSGLSFDLPGGRQLNLVGNAVHLRGADKGVLPVGGFGLTRVSLSDWEYIKKTYANLPLIKNGLLFAHDSQWKAEDQAKEMKDSRHGREPVNIENSSTSEALLKK